MNEASLFLENSGTALIYDNLRNLFFLSLLMIICGLLISPWWGIVIAIGAIFLAYGMLDNNIMKEMKSNNLIKTVFVLNILFAIDGIVSFFISIFLEQSLIFWFIVTFATYSFVVLIYMTFRDRFN